METLFDAADALELVSAYFEEEWPRTNVQDVKLEQLTGGLINRLYKLSRQSPAKSEPVVVLIRHFGGSGDRQQQPFDSSTTLSAAEQAIVHLEMARRGWGPNVYGVFQGGRLEEYIDAHTLTAEESTNASIRCDVARSYARLHSLRLPFRKDNFKLVVEELIESFESRDKVLDFLRDLDSTEATECANAYQETDWGSEMVWTSSLFAKHNCKPAFTASDTNYLNVLVKNYESDCRAMLIDYETVTYSYRGLDIGGHFTERMYSWNQPASKLTGNPMPDVEEQRTFCEAYLQELRQLGQAVTANDTIDHLLLEAQIGQMHQLLFVIFMCLDVEDTESDPFFLSSVVHMMKLYWQLKENFIRLQQPEK